MQFESIKLERRIFAIAKGLGIAISKIKNRPFSYIKTPSMRRGLSIRRKGIVFSEVTKEKMKLVARKGVDNNMWKGGITPLHFKIRNSEKNKVWRKSILERDNYTCVLCGLRGRGDLHVDHFPVTFSVILHNLLKENGTENAYEAAMDYPYFWDISNGRTLCIGCHKGVKHIVKRKKRQINLLEYNGQSKTLVEWCKDLGISHRTACGRQERGLPVEEILSTKTLILKKKNIILVTHNGVSKPITEWCRELGLNPKLVRRRVQEFKWSVEDALFHPNRQRKYNNDIPIKFLKVCRRSTKKRGNRNPIKT